MNKKEVFIINGKSIHYEVFYSLVDLRRKELKNREEIKLSPTMTLEFLVSLWASLLEGKYIDLDVEASEEFMDGKIASLVEKNDYLSLVFESEFVIKYRNEVYTGEMIRFKVEKLFSKKIMNKKDVFCFFNKDTLVNENIDTLIFYTLVPILLGSMFIFSDKIDSSFAEYRPTIFMGSRKDVKVLHSLMLKVPNSSNLVENFYHLFRKSNNLLWGQLINRFLIFDSFRSLKSIIVNDVKDLNGLWIDFESLGINIYTLKHKKENITINEDV